MSASSHDQEDEEAALWVARHMGGLIDATAFSDWLAGGEGRREKFDALWAMCMDDAVTEGLRLHERQIRDRESIRPRTMARFAIAACAVALVAVMTLYWPRTPTGLGPSQTYETAIGQVRGVTLADGSRVTLNGASKIRVEIAGARRQVALEAGEALFDVQHDETRPFVVNAGSGRVTVLGTRFDLALNAERLDLAVERGLVRFEKSSGDPAAVLVPASHQSTLDQGEITPPTQLGTMPAAAWQSGWLEMADLPLAQIIPRLERWTGRPIIVKDRSLLRKRVAGRFRLSNPKLVLDNLGTLYGFAVNDTGQAYILDTPAAPARGGAASDESSK